MENARRNIKEEGVKNMSLDKLAKNVVFLSEGMLEGSISYEYFRGWHDGARKVMKMFGNGDK